MRCNNRNTKTGEVERLPVEKGEKRHETAASSKEGDNRGDQLEWCLREYEVTTIDALKSNEVTTKADQIDEHRLDADHGSNQPSNKESENSSCDGNKPKRDEGGNSEGEALTGEHPQRPEQEHQNTSPEFSQHSKTSVAELLSLDNERESDPSAKQDTKHQEEGRVSLRLSEYPQAFIEGNRELLIKEGIVTENDEAKLGNKTTLKLDENKGLTIIHEEQHYKITTVEQEKIGDLELRRYKTDQGGVPPHTKRKYNNPAVRNTLVRTTTNHRRVS